MSASSRVASVVLWLLAAVLAIPPAAVAQPCTADAQCRNAGAPETSCAGNALVSTRHLCVGSCRAVEESRIPCPSACVGGRCIDVVRDPAGSGSAPARVPRCVAQCACRNGLLLITTGDWSPEQGCHQLVRRCGRGCVCQPEPRCK